MIIIDKKHTLTIISGHTLFLYRETTSTAKEFSNLDYHNTTTFLQKRHSFEQKRVTHILRKNYEFRFTKLH